MNTKFFTSRALLAGAILLTATIADARSYGVSRSSAGRGTKYTTSRGGEAYVGPRGVAAEGAGGTTAVAGRRGAAVAGPNGGAAVAGRYGAAAVGPNGGVAVATSPVYRPPVYVAPLPAAYIRTVPVGYTTVVYGGYSCRLRRRWPGRWFLSDRVCGGWRWR